MNRIVVLDVMVRLIRNLILSQNMQYVRRMGLFVEGNVTFRDISAIK